MMKIVRRKQMNSKKISARESPPEAGGKLNSP